MEIAQFFEKIFSFLFKPRKTLESQLNEEIPIKNPKSSYLWIIYLSILIATTLWFFIYYPEPLYYGVPESDLRRDLPSIISDEPLLFLLFLILTNIFTVFFYSYLLFGFLSFKIMKRFQKTKSNAPAFKDYLHYYTYTFGPEFLLNAVLFYWFFFFERLIFIKPIYPLIDITIPNIIFLGIVGSFLLWKLFIEIKINQVFFDVSPYKAAIPFVIQSILLIIDLSIPFLFNDLIFALFQGELT